MRTQLEQQGLPGTDKAPLALEQLVQAVWEAESFITTAAAVQDGSSSTASSTEAAVHPARSMPYNQLYAAVQAEVAAGTVHRTTDPDSGLEVFCYDLSTGPPSSSTAVMCRGMVLHPASSSVVATPFARFGGPQSMPAVSRALAAAAAGGGGSSCSSGSSSTGGNRGARANNKGGRGQLLIRDCSAGPSTRQLAKVAASEPGPGSLQLYQHWGQAPIASASVKVDGSFVLAFLWQGQLQVATRRRMDSEQVGVGSGAGMQRCCVYEDGCLKAVRCQTVIR